MIKMKCVMHKCNVTLIEGESPVDERASFFLVDLFVGLRGIGDDDKGSIDVFREME
jgi:hypothetical protein